MALRGRKSAGERRRKLDGLRILETQDGPPVQEATQRLPKDPECKRHPVLSPRLPSLTGEGQWQDADNLKLRHLFVWLTLADQCLVDPECAFKEVGGRGSDGRGSSRVPNFRKEIEKRCSSKRLMQTDRDGRRRGRLTWEGLLLAEIAACIEHMWFYFLETEEKDARAAAKRFQAVRETVFKTLPIDVRRDFDRYAYKDIVPAYAPKARIKRATLKNRVMRQEYLESPKIVDGFDRFPLFARSKEKIAESLERQVRFVEQSDESEPGARFEWELNSFGPQI